MNAATRQKLLDLVKERAVIRQRVTLASGKTSDFYIDGRSLYLFGPAATLLGEAIYELTKGLNLAALGGPEVGALPLTAAATMHYHKVGIPMEGFFVRKEAKTHGLQKKVEGVLPPGGRVAIVEDVMTTGGSAISAVKAVQEAGATVAAVVCVVDRLQGAGEQFAALGIPFRPAFTLRDLGL